MFNSHSRAPCTAKGALPLLLSLSVVTGCDCNGGPRVPFKLQADASVDADVGEPTKAPTSATFAPGETPQSLEGATLPWAAVRAVLATDLDQDGDRDVIAVYESGGLIQLAAALRNGDVFEAPRDVWSAPGNEAGESCLVEYAEIQTLSATKALALFSRVCGPEKRAEPRSYAVLSLEPTPRVLALVSEQVSADSPEPFFTIDATSLDADGDTHDDVVLSFSPRGYGSPEDAVRLVWFDRPSGLVRDVREPETTLKAWADAARAQVAQSPEQALERAELALRIRRALCSEDGEPSVRFAERPGIACGSGKSATEAWITSVLAHARLKNVARTFDAYKQLKKRGGTIDSKTASKLDEALASLPASPGIVLRRGTRVEPKTAPQVRLPAVRFLGETHLLVTRAESVLFDVVSGEESSLQVPEDALMRDPSGQLAVTSLEHTCTGYYVRIERAPTLGERYFSLPSSAAALWPETPSAECGLKKSQKREIPQGLFSVLGWAPQGVIVALGSETRIVPLDLAGKPAGAPRALPPRSPLPAPLPTGQAAPDGARYVEATPFGVLVYNVREGDAELWRPEGYLSLGKSVREAAVSPSGRRVAVVTGDTFYTLERAP